METLNGTSKAAVILPNGDDRLPKHITLGTLLAPTPQST